MTLQNYSALILVVVAVSALFAASPFLETVLVVPQTDPITELYMLGPLHNTTYPYSIGSYEHYRLYVGVVNHEAKQSSYEIQVKFRNQQQATAETYTKTPISSSEQVLTKMPLQLPNNSSQENPLDISFQYVVINETLHMQSIVINSGTYNIQNTLNRDYKGEFLGNLVFELWMLNSSQNTFVYQSQVSLWIKLT
jgi:hypothetical protein